MKKLGGFSKTLKCNKLPNELNKEMHEKKCLFYTKIDKTEIF